MSSAIIQIVTGISILTNAIIYGIDVFGGVIMKSVLAKLDDATMTSVAGWGHYFGDRRLPVAGITGLVSAVVASVISLITAHYAAAVATLVATIALVLWLGLYATAAKPINALQKAAALGGTLPDDARELQTRWDSLLPARISLQTTALVALVVAVALA